ncbi:MAG: phenylalanine--tRNA ligase subunit beta [Myxococcales bacterium]|nr:phenylalanine--tRNA ligase subunit beta [Myxococcales bacterium]
MRLSLDWLAEFVDLPALSDLTERLEMSGFEDVFVEATGPDLSAIRVGRVETCEPHPDADRLRLCGVDVGQGERHPIVCGAPNVAAGQKVAVALPGTRLPDGTKLTKAKIRGQVSMGMICSRRELGLGDEHEGILVLDAEAPLGTALSDVIAAGPRVLEIGLTPNRGDAASLLGLGRELQALFPGPLRLPESSPEERGAPAADAISLQIDAPEACHHYVARIVRGLRVEPSPAWLVERLEASGIRPVNNVVDVTNLVLLEFGQPLHAFDLKTLRDARVIVRFAEAGEVLATLDGQSRKLDPEDLVIADGERAIALAGVMGGAETEVGDGTRDVLIESAHFAPGTVRFAARRHGLHSEASYRFERGVDPQGVARAADRAARLLAELAGGEVAAGRVEATGRALPEPPEIRFDVAHANRLLGTAYSEPQAVAWLERVGITCESRGNEGLVCRGPSHRHDLELPEDLIEEVARIGGYEKIPTTLPVAELAPATLPAGWRLADQARDSLAGLGFSESMSMPFTSARDLAALRLEESDPRRQPLVLSNPIQEQEGLLRTTLVPSLLRIARQNLSRQLERVRIFETCKVFLSQGGAEEPAEPRVACALLAGNTERRLWAPEPAPPIFFEARGSAERLFSSLGYVASFRSGEIAPYLHPGAGAEIHVEGSTVGAVGELHPEVAAAFEIEVPCALLEVNLDALLELEPGGRRFREVSREPAVHRDLAVLVERGQAAEELLAVVRKAAGADLISVELFDRYEGSKLPEGQVSLAFHLVFQRADRSLTDDEVSKRMDRVLRKLTGSFGATLR